MKIVINNKLAKIVDFVYYPYMGRFLEELEQNPFFEDVDLEQYEELTKEIQKKMKNHFEVIDKFYSQEFNPIIEIIGGNILLESNDIDEYLNKALDLDENTIRKNLMIVLMKIVGKKEMIKGYIMEEKYKDKNFLLSTVKNTTLSSSMKWNIFCAIEEPVKYIKEYVEFMEKLKKEFNILWRQGEVEISDYRKIFEKNIESGGVDFLNSIVDDYFDKEHLKNSTCILSLSYVCGDKIMMREIEDKILLHWGYKVEELFNKIKERKEFELEKKLRIMKTLGDKTKYNIIKLIVENPEISANDIAKELELTAATVSYHLNLMKTYKLLKVTKGDKKKSFELDEETLKNLIKGIVEDFELQDLMK
ncbi:ArsR/SmtB family transcription factor [Oceanirhabdus sp. W0125-5]|uniref:ArsR/SmtB family transcription factor n=1 Tax=Oceanirhabdus sp. W0125-5 TaxID=2999116 RepID=UPI0022F2D625|nr:winged helix-turn-helix domain-containing protein [Oceanirhabdus sp. W0125-5]WBW96897.1 winged helix-turn-helix domain-containing protein [Oceanirhabdus sp. W0125-5]